MGHHPAGTPRGSTKRPAAHLDLVHDQQVDNLAPRTAPPHRRLQSSPHPHTAMHNVSPTAINDQSPELLTRHPSKQAAAAAATTATLLPRHQSPQTTLRPPPNARPTRRARRSSSVPPPPTFLAPGLAFSGTQNVNPAASPAPPSEHVVNNAINQAQNPAAQQLFQALPAPTNRARQQVPPPIRQQANAQLPAPGVFFDLATDDIQAHIQHQLRNQVAVGSRGYLERFPDAFAQALTGPFGRANPDGGVGPAYNYILQQRERRSLEPPSRATESDAWRVNVRIMSVDMKRGVLSGTMEAHDVPKTNSPVITFWEGEIIDNCNFYFRTGRWDATRYNDVEHWSRFPGFVPKMMDIPAVGEGAKVPTTDGSSLSPSAGQYIYMRWKESHFENAAADCGLTIAGFYYICMDRSTGYVVGYYYDPYSAPFQKLELRPSTEKRAGFAFADYSFN